MASTIGNSGQPLPQPPSSTTIETIDHHHQQQPVENQPNIQLTDAERKFCSKTLANFSTNNQIEIFDPSEHFRPEHKSVEQYRMYNGNQHDRIQKRVSETYRLMHTYQTVSFVRDRFQYWTQFDKAQLTIMQALHKLNSLIDESDPDVDLPNIVHAFQTAERIRKAYPDLHWFQLTGLIHDLGKLMALYGEPQWAVVGDTFPVGCQFADSIVLGGKETFQQNADYRDTRYNTKYGMYQPNCGLEHVTFSWGHDEYLYQVLKNHSHCSLPEEALYIIRYHSFYPWHSSGDYYHLCSQWDMQMLPWVQRFNKFDLYSKSEQIPDMEHLATYYQKLIDQYIPYTVRW